MPPAGHDAYVAGLRLLAMRELTETQVRERLARRQYDASDIETAVARLREERALDDQRTAAAYARTEHGRGRGRLRILRRLESMGVSREMARTAVEQVLTGTDEAEVVERVLMRRLRQGESLRDPRVSRRLFRFLLAQGFDAGQVSAALRRRAAHTDDDIT